MIRFESFYAIAMASLLMAVPATAQPVVQEPGMEAFVHPDSDLGIGMSWPAANANAQAAIQSARPIMRHALHAKGVRSGSK